MLMPLASTLPLRSAATGAGVGGNTSQRSAAFVVGAERTRNIVNNRRRIVLLLFLRYFRGQSRAEPGQPSLQSSRYLECFAARTMSPQGRRLDRSGGRWLFVFLHPFRG